MGSAVSRYPKPGKRNPTVQVFAANIKTTRRLPRAVVQVRCLG